MWWTFALLMAPSFATPSPARPRLDGVRTWMYQIQQLDQPGAVEALAKSGYDLLVVEPTATVRGSESFDARGMVARLRDGKRSRTILAYLDLAQAERYRGYWSDGWRPPGRGTPGIPDFLLAADPDGWSDNYVVRYWDPRWQALMLSEVRTVMEMGFDGLYLDWIEAYDDAKVRRDAKRARLDSARAMVDLLAAVRAEARRVRADAVTVIQNAPYLVDADPRVLSVVDAVAFEDTWFSGRADVAWDDPRGGDLPNRYRDEYGTAARLRQYARWKSFGKPVFTVDYCLRRRHAAKVYEEARRRGFVPLVTRVSLARTTSTPPPSAIGIRHRAARKVPTNP